MDFWEEKKAPEIRTVIPVINGVFSHMTGYTFKADINKQQLDTLFIADYGRRNPTPIVDLIAEKYDVDLDDTLPETALAELSQLMLGMYKPKWDKLGEIYDIEYDPIHNYLDEWEDEMEGSRNSTENVDEDTTETLNTTKATSNTRTDNLAENISDSKSISNTRTDNLVELETRNLSHSNSGSDADNVFAFDSNNAVGKRTGSESGSGSDTGTVNTANTGTQTNAGTETDTKSITNTGTQSDSGSIRDTGTISTDKDRDTEFSQTEGRERSGRHFGNIGNLTSQKQIQEEIELWKWNYMRSILKDAADFLCLQVYLNY